MNALPKTRSLLAAIENLGRSQRLGQVRAYNGLVVRGAGPDARIGELCEIEGERGAPPVCAEVIGFDGGDVLLLPLGDVRGMAVDSRITASGHGAEIALCDQLLGRVVDGFARPIDDGPPLPPGQRRASRPGAVPPLSRVAIDTQLETGISVLDLFLPLGLGQRIGIFAGSGVGKSTLLGMCARNLQTDVSVVCLVGERGREVGEFLEQVLGSSRNRAVVVVATADEPAALRVQAVHTAHAIAEHFCDQGRQVLLVVDSITRLAMAQREIGLAAGEPPTYRGYTPSVFGLLPRLAERCGRFRTRGSITAIYSVLVEGDDHNDPIGDHMRAILDGHVVLDRRIGARGQFPAIDVLASISRLEGVLLDARTQALVRQARALLSAYEESRDLIEMGAYQAGSHPQLDRALAVLPALRALLAQSPGEQRSLTDSRSTLADILAEAANVAAPARDTTGKPGDPHAA